jgi:hypothetical protein
VTIKIVSNEDGLVTLSSIVDGEIHVVDVDEQLLQLSSENIALLPNNIVEIQGISTDTNATGLVWDKVGERVYETGLDRGVLYLPNGSAVPWNGLTSVIEAFNRESSPVYFDGMKINDLITLGEFTATMKAVTYPEDFVEIEGNQALRNGVYAGDQKPQSFGLSYRTQIGNDLDGSMVGYKIHLLYNVTAIPREKTYASISADPSLVEFEWDITAVPEEAPGLQPTAHFIINSLETDPWLLEDIEKILYGDSTAVASLIPMSDLVAYINDWFRIKIVDNGDGTWSAVTLRDGFISFLDVEETLFQIVHANAVYLSEDEYLISDTVDISDIPQIRIDDNGDGTWTATTEHDNLISVDSSGLFEIRNANVIQEGVDFYQITDTEDEG